MRKSFLLYCGLFATFVAGGIYSCKKTTGVDNNNVITTPYSLYFSDSAGALYYTNDGRNYAGSVFPPDGKPGRALLTSGENVLWAKTHLYYSNNDGRNINHTYDTLPSYPATLCNGQLMNLNQSMVINIPEWDNRVFCATASPDPSRNWLGVMFSYQNGNPGSWIYDGSYDTTGVGFLPVRMTSFTFLANGVLCGLAYSGPAENDNYHVRNFLKAGKDGDADYSARWREVTGNPDGISYIFMGSGSPLPPYGATFIDSSYFTLGHFNNRLIAIDSRCNYGAWYSDDTGHNWAQYTGLPANTPLLCINAPFEEVCLIGTAGKGVYILNQHTGVWEPDNNGLGSNASVRSIAFKKNIYKNGTVRKFIYLATDRGIYESVDGGRNWVQTIGGNYVSVY